MKLIYLNLSFFILSLIVELSLSQTLLSQELKYQKKSLGSRMIEEYDVLKNNKDIKEGLYTLKIENLICQTGSYKNNQRSGPWRIFYSKDVLEFEYNYDTNELTYFNKKYYVSENDSTLIRPIFLGGIRYFYQSIKNNIDPSQMQWGNGSLSVSFEVDPSGIPHKFLLNSSCGYKNLDMLTLNAVKIVATSNFKFLPAKKDGLPLPFVMVIPINYMARIIEMGPLK